MPGRARIEHGAIGMFDQHEGCHGFEHADLHLLAFAGAFTMEQRHGRGVQRVMPETLSAMMVPTKFASPVSISLHGGQAARRLNGIVVGCPIPIRAAPAVAITVGINYRQD
jgi:hypothetical protein